MRSKRLFKALEGLAIGNLSRMGAQLSELIDLCEYMVLDTDDEDAHEALAEVNHTLYTEWIGCKDAAEGPLSNPMNAKDCWDWALNVRQRITDTICDWQDELDGSGRCA